MKVIENKLLVKSNETNQSWSIFENGLFTAICSKYWNIVMTTLWRHSHLSKCVKYLQVKWCLHPPSLVAIRPVEIHILKYRDGQNLTSMLPSAFEYGSAVFFVEKSVEFSNLLRHWFLNVIKKNFCKIQLPSFKLTFNDISKKFFTNEFQKVFVSISFREWPISKKLSIQTLKKIYPLSKEKETL